RRTGSRTTAHASRSITVSCRADSARSGPGVRSACPAHTRTRPTQTAGARAGVARSRWADGGRFSQDSVMALGFAVANADHASASGSGARINRELFYELNGGTPGPPSWWLDRQKIATDGLSYGLVKLNPPP